MAGVDYQARLVSEARRYSACTYVHALPEIFHYWSNRYLRPKFQEFGFSSPNDLFQQTVDRAFDGPGPRRFLSLGAGNCDVEIRLASNLTARGVTGFVIDCVDVNAQMLERGRLAAAEHKVSAQLNLIHADLNSWFAHIQKSLAAGGRFVIIDTIGRNGHLRWPEALGLVREFWRKLPPSYRYHLLLDRYEEMFEDWDCSQDGFEGVRSQDILPLLVERFPFQLFVGYGNLLDPFVDRAFGHHFNAEAEWDRDFIDQVHRRNDQGLATGELKPTQMAAIVANEGNGTTRPGRFIRDPELAVESPCATVQSPYECPPAWPDQSELLGARIKACDLRIREHQRREAEAAAAIEGLARESADRAGWAMRLSRELEERSGWAHSLKRELEQGTALCSTLESQSGERTAWALRLDRELEQSSALVERLRADLDARTRWAREREQTLAERTGWAAQLQAELESSRSAARGGRGWMRRALRKLRS